MAPSELLPKKASINSSSELKRSDIFFFNLKSKLLVIFEALGLNCILICLIPFFSWFLKQVIVAQASVQRCSASVDFLNKDRPFFPVTVNSKDLHGHFQKVAAKMLGVSNVVDRKPVMGAEDFALFGEVIPAAYYYFVGMVNETQGPMYPAHSPYFTINEAALPYGAALHASLAMSYLSEKHTSLSSTEKVHDEL